MAIGKNTGVQNPYGQGDYKITLSSTETLRKFLLGKNLQSSYLADGNPLSPPFGVQTPGDFSYQNLSDNFVIDQKTVLETGVNYQNNLFLDNSYGPEGGYKDVLLIDVKKVLPRAQSDYISPNTLQPKSFVASVYTPQEILDTVNITNGIINTINEKVLNDSKLVQDSSGYLRRNLGELQAQYLYEISDEGSGNANISTDPRSNQIQGTDFISRISNMYYGYSDIPGNYFQETFVPDINQLQVAGINQGGVTQNIQATASAVADILTGGQGIPNNPFSVPNPSDTFINYMGEESQTALFGSLTFNTYRPDYSRVFLQPGVENVVPFYYVGSKESEPGKIQSPMGAVPSDKFGRSTGALVYGPSTLAKELETVNGRPLWYFYNFGLGGYSYMDGGGLDAGWTWFGNYSFASLNAPSGYLSSRSITKPKRKGGILDETQKLIDSAPLMGGARRKHAGHAIDQTSKIFNDGYKDISKGSGARFVDESSGVFGIGAGLKVREFCRTWTKDNPYYRMNNLVRSGGVSRAPTSSIMSNTYNLNIAPTTDSSGEPVNFGLKDGESITKYMFSIENLAWRGTPELLALPQSEQGPNGGRVMWFPPYDINVGDTNSVQWNSVNFLGRPDPVYTYNYTERIGTLSFKIVVDHASIMNVIAQKELDGVPDYIADQAIESFIAGCKKYDIYELASVYSNLSIDNINQYVNEVTTQYNDDPAGTLGAEGGGTPNMPINPSGLTQSGGGGEDAFASQTGGGGEDVINGESANDGTPLTEEEQSLQNNTNTESTERTLNTNKILSELLGEQSYFKYLEQEDEFVYDSLKRKLKYFSPAFHSMTPEGLNSRLTFLLQCTRPGRTIPTQTEGGVENVDAENTAFGAPPICVLRIGDFYHTKIAIDSVSFSYDPLLYDMNPEGIGMQPMIANVQMNFKYIGGQGLEKPVSELQNALSFNFFGNTEVYDSRSTTTTKQQSLTDEQEILDELAPLENGFNINQTNLNTTDGGESGGDGFDLNQTNL